MFVYLQHEKDKTINTLRNWRPKQTERRIKCIK